MLLDLNTIREELDEQFLPLEPALTGFRMSESRFSESDIFQLSDSLAVKLPPEFIELLLYCDLGNLTIGPVVFGNECDYAAALADLNIQPQCIWWSASNKPEDIIIVAISDPYTIGLDCNTGKVIAFPNDQSVESAEIVASDFKTFVRGIATCILRRTENNKIELGNVLATLCKSDSPKFWIQLAA